MPYYPNPKPKLLTTTYRTVWVFLPRYCSDFRWRWWQRLCCEERVWSTVARDVLERRWHPLEHYAMLIAHQLED